MSANFSEGSSIDIDGTFISYDEKTDEYEIEIHDAYLLCLDIKSQMMRIKIHSNKLQLLNNNNDDDNKIESPKHSKQHIEDEASDDTEQEQEEDEQEEEHKQNNNITNDMEVNDDETKDNSNNINEINEMLIPKDQDEIIELSHDEHDDNEYENDTLEHKSEDKSNDKLNEEIPLTMNGHIMQNDIQNDNTQSINDDKITIEGDVNDAMDNIVNNNNNDKIDMNNEECINKMNDNDNDSSDNLENKNLNNDNNMHIIDNVNDENDINNINNDNNENNTHNINGNDNIEKDNTDTIPVNNDNNINDINNMNMENNENDKINDNITTDNTNNTNDIKIDNMDIKIDDNNMNNTDNMNVNNINNYENGSINDAINTDNINNMNDIKIDNNMINTDDMDINNIDNINNNENNNTNDSINSDNINNISDIKIDTNINSINTKEAMDNIDIKIDDSSNTNRVDEYASSDERCYDSDNERSIKIEHNLRDPFIDEILTKQINAALKIESDSDPKNAEEYINSNEEEGIKNAIKHKNNWRWALKPENIAIEWRKYAPTINLQNFNTMTKSLTKITTNSITSIVNIAAKNKIICTLSIDECDCVQRLIFIMKYYSYWMKFKTETNENPKLEENINISEYNSTITSLISSLKAYNKSKLLRDYLHIRHYHFNDDKLIAYIHRSQIPDCNDKNKMCKCITRNHQNKEIYHDVNIIQARKLYWMNNNTSNEGSIDEMIEINLQQLLDVIHSSFLHNAISNGTKFVTKINIDQDQQQEIMNKNEKKRTAFSSLSSLHSGKSADILNKPIIIDVPNYEFGIKFNFHNKKQHKTYCGPKYPNLKTELLNNTIHSLSLNDFTSIYNRAHEYILCDEGCKSMFSKRTMYNIYKGTKISIENVIVILSRCNYSEIERKFNMNSWMEKTKQRNNKVMNELRDKNSEIYHWNKLLNESIILFGELLDDLQYVYHGINYKITFKDISGIQFNIPISCTTQYSVARNFASEYLDGICLKLGRMQLTKDINYMFDISDFSDYPNEREVLIFGIESVSNRLSFVDIVYDSLSHHDYVLSLKLYQKIIRGRWFTTNNDYHNKKHQRRIVKMIENMIDKHNNNQLKDNNENDMVKIDLDLGLNYIDPYIQSLFECITKNVLKKVIWINKESDTLLPELKTVFINNFIPFLKQKPYYIQSKYAHVDTWNITKKHLLMTDRNNALISKTFDHVEILNNDNQPSDDDEKEINNNINEPMSLKQFKQVVQKKEKPTDLKITFGFRCYKKYDNQKKLDMFKGEFIVIELPKGIESVKMLGGLWFPSIPFCKWDWCSFSNKKKSKGSSLFPLNQINVGDEQFKIKICYQVKEVIEKVNVSLP